MNNFFIVSLPRSRTAWLANLLTNGDNFCFHEALRTVSSVAELKEKMETFNIQHSTPNTQCVGDADPAILAVFDQVYKAFPQAAYVFIERDWQEAAESYKRAFPKISGDDLLPRFQTLSDRLREAINSAMKAYTCCVFQYRELENYKTCAQLYNFCTCHKLHKERWALLNDLRVTAMAEKAASTLAPWAKVAVSNSAYQQTPAGTAWLALMAEICGERQDALTWLNGLWNLALTWDHLHDGDPVDLLLAEGVLETMLLDWPANNFWRTCAPGLLPVLSNALAAWRTGDRARGYDIYTETACAVALLLGGRQAVARYSPRIRQQAADMMRENDNKEKGA